VSRRDAVTELEYRKAKGESFSRAIVERALEQLQEEEERRVEDRPGGVERMLGMAVERS
jgi:hypothetical protein